MVIKVIDHVRQCNTSTDGAIIASVLREQLRSQSKVQLSFTGVSDVPSSFVNSAIVSLLDEFTEDQVKSKLTITDVTSQIAGMIRRCLQNGLNARAT